MASADLTTPRALELFTAVSGIVTIAGFAGFAACISDVPPIDAAPADLASWVADHGTTIVVGLQLMGISTMAVWAFYLGFREVCGRGLLATTGAVAGCFIFLISWAGMVPLAALKYLGSDASLEQVRLCHVLISVMVNFTGLPTAASVVPFSVLMLRETGKAGGAVNTGAGEAATGAKFGAVLAWYGVVVSAAHCVSSCAFAHSGMLSPSGLGQWVCPPAYYVWMLWICIVLFKGRGSDPATRSLVGRSYS